MQEMLFKQLSLMTPLRYFGGKILAIPVLDRFIPRAVDELVSPFFGSGALELALTGRGVRIHGYDKFPPIPHFFQTLQADPDAVANCIRRSLCESNGQEIWQWACDAYSTAVDSVRKAALVCIIYNSSFNGRGFGGERARVYVQGEQLIYPHSDGNPRYLLNYDRIERFHNPLVQVRTADFRDSLGEHPDAFAYCDPPYPIHGSAYGDSPEYHKDFPHSELAQILHNRVNWVLSYNDVPLIRELYPPEQFDWYQVQWHQGSRGKGRQKGNDVVITPRGQNHESKTQVP